MSDWRGVIFSSSQQQIKKMEAVFHQCSTVIQSCSIRAAGSGECAGTGFWITTPCPSITSGEGCLETSTPRTKGTTAGSSSLKVRVSPADTLSAVERRNYTRFIQLLLKRLWCIMCLTAAYLEKSNRGDLLVTITSFLFSAGGDLKGSDQYISNMIYLLI